MASLSTLSPRHLSCHPPSVTRTSDDPSAASGQSAGTSPKMTVRDGWPAVELGKSSLCATEDTGSRFNEESLALLEDEDEDLIIGGAKQRIDAKVICMEEGVAEKIEVVGCSVVSVKVRDFCISRNEMVDYVLELTLNGIYHRAPNDSFVRIHTPPSPCFTGLPLTPSAAAALRATTSAEAGVAVEDSQESSGSGFSPTVGPTAAPLRYQVLLEGPPDPSAEFEVLKFTTSSVVRLDVDRYHDLSPEDYHRLTFEEPRLVFEALAQELFPQVNSSSPTNYHH
ncbi:hypothetical protein FOZ60_007224 [Perkinsus olseni]|uniref:Uncharacterized protein n=1 Tax=Perkinsus olseni TaxID=32597 RepID=A0A7J6PH35_PEROL|nr:hypothetical protein FOZ60_007224 [Perkinsus olseni]